MKKRILSFLLCLLLVLPCIVSLPGVSAEEASSNAGISLTSDETVNEDGSVTTKYGTIPNSSAITDGTKYPFAIFVNGEFAAALQSYSGETTSHVLGYLLFGKKADGTAFGKGDRIDVLLRADYTWTDSDKTTYIHGRYTAETINIDLNGYTLNAGNNPLLNIQLRPENDTSGAAATASDYITVFTMLNGTVTNSYANGLVRYGKDSGSGNFDAGNDVNFTNVIFKNIYGGASTTSNLHPNEAGAVLYDEDSNIHTKTADNFTGSTGGSDYQLRFTFTGCVWDNDTVEAPVWRDGTTTWTGLIKIPITCEHHDTDGDNACDFCKDTGVSFDGTAHTAPTKGTETLDGLTLTTKYGTITATASDSYVNAEKYPFAFFIDGEFVEVCQDWTGAKDDATRNHLWDVLIKETYKNKNVDVLLRADYTNDAEAHNDDVDTVHDNVSDRFYQLNALNINIDLNGYTINMGAEHLIIARLGGSSSTAETTWVTTLKIFGGTVTSSASIVHYSKNTGSTSATKYQYDAGNAIVFENVTFKDVNVDSTLKCEQQKSNTGDPTNTDNQIVYTNDDNIRTKENDGFIYNANPYVLSIKFDKCMWENDTDEYANWCDPTDYTGSIRVNISCECHDTNADAKCDFCGNTLGVELLTRQATLGDYIRMTFTAKLPANVVKAFGTVNGKTTEYTVSELTPVEGIYTLVVNVSSIEMREEIALSFCDADDKVIPVSSSLGTADAYTTTVKDYIEAAAEEMSDEEWAVADALLNYGAYAEKYFGVDADLSTAIDANSAASAIADVNASDITGTVSGTSDKLGVAKLILNDATTIRIMLNSAADVAGGENIEYVANTEANVYYVDITGIDAANLATPYSFTVDGTDVEVSVLGVAGIVANDEEKYGADFANLMKALYLYSVACEALV